MACFITWTMLFETPFSDSFQYVCHLSDTIKVTQKKRLWHKSFSVNFAKFLRTPFLQNTSGWLLYSLRLITCFILIFFSSFSKKVSIVCYICWPITFIENILYICFYNNQLFSILINFMEPPEKTGVFLWILRNF